MKHRVSGMAAGALVSLGIATTANAGFVGAYDPSTWGWNTSSYQHCCMTWDGTSSFTAAALLTNVHTRVWHLTETEVDVSFDWAFGWDTGGWGRVYYFNGDPLDLHLLAEMPGSGHMTLHLNQGFFGFEVWGMGSNPYGRSQLTLSNFDVEGLPVPEPASLPLAATALLILAALARRDLPRWHGPSACAGARRRARAGATVGA